MRVVLDTNVLVSAALKQQSMPGMAALVVDRRGGLLKSVATERQLFDVISRPYFGDLINLDTRAWLKKLIAAAERVTIGERIAACRDPTDDKFLELAVNGHADLIVSATPICSSSIRSGASRSSHPPPSCGAWRDSSGNTGDGQMATPE
jgi:putative PIN family toxin of toxin-antitoxin system